MPTAPNDGIFPKSFLSSLNISVLSFSSSSSLSWPTLSPVKKKKHSQRHNSPNPESISASCKFGSQAQKWPKITESRFQVGFYGHSWFHVLFGQNWISLPIGQLLPYIFWKLLIRRFIWAIRKHILSTLWGVTFLLTQWDWYVHSILHSVLSIYSQSVNEDLKGKASVW